MDISAIHHLFLQTSGVCTDTRKISQDCFFVALKGDNFDANTFALEALAKGAAYVMVDDPEVVSDKRMILVNDSLIGLQQLANFHRNHLALPIVALTGSNGKTTTKELIHAVLSQKFKAKATVGNLNNHIGVPLTLLSFTSETQIGIVEMGANHQKEIEALCQIAEPDFGYITNFGKAHLEGFGGVSGVIKGKSELYDFLRSSDKLVFVNGDDPIQMEKTEGIHRSTFGSAEEFEVTIREVVSDPFVSLQWNHGLVNSNLIGLYNATNVSAAVAIGSFFSVDPHLIAEAIAAYIPHNNRSQIVERGGHKIILDAYNANPSSMSAAIENFVQLKDELPKTMILGDMFELGEESASEHRALVKKVSALNEVSVHLIGESFFREKEDFGHIRFYKDRLAFEAAGGLSSFPVSLILVKGSRGMALERLLESLS